MRSENAIEVTNVVKKFKVYLDKGRTLKEKVLFSNRRKYEERLVLDHISFHVKKGEAVGLIGHNGCGKSTTLKLLTRIMYPDSGSINMRGRVSSLIELGAGFHPDMSGRDNIYTNAAIFGLTKKEIDARIHDIISFSELEDFIDNPVRTYSSGMYMRLAFSVAINVDADVLLIDEILAVGDANFQTKCFMKLRDIKNTGTTIVIVSHALGQIEEICDRSVWIQDGKIKAEGPPRDIHPQYLDFMGRKRLHNLAQEDENAEQKVITSKDGSKTEIWKNGQKVRWGNFMAQITKIHLTDEDGQEKAVFKTGEVLHFYIKYEVKQKVENAVLGIGIFRSDGLECFGTNTRVEQYPAFDLEEDGEFELVLTDVNLITGEYDINITLEMGINTPVDFYTKAIKVAFYSEIHDAGVCRIPHQWSSKFLR